MAENTPSRSRKRRHAPDDEANWASEGEMERVREVKILREEREPYNKPGALQMARRVGKEEARKSSLSETSSKKAPPRGLVEGSSSSEFMSAVEEPTRDNGAFYSGAEHQADAATKPKKFRKRKRKPADEPIAPPKEKKRRRRRHNRNRKHREGANGEENGEESKESEHV
jgi:hypothetical protein